MTDVFIRTASNLDLIRQGFFLAVQGRWAIEASIHVSWDMPVREARLEAERRAESDPYIFTDDDVLIVGKDWVKRGVEAMLACPEYGVASTLSLVEGENLATGTGTIYPMHAVGQPMFIRKGLMADLPESSPDGPFFTFECQIIQAHVEAKGFKEGIINGLRHNHLGHGFSGTPALHWGY